MKFHHAVLNIIVSVGIIMGTMVYADNITANGKPGQTVPDAKRQREIRVALIAHGYEPGRSWDAVRDVLKQIAREHHWQSTHAPDARVLILLGLGNKHSDPAVLDEK